MLEVNNYAIIRNQPNLSLTHPSLSLPLLSPLPLPLPAPELLLLLLLLLLFVDFVLTLLRRREAAARTAAMLLFLDESIRIFGGKPKATTDLRGEVVVLVDAAIRAAAAVGGDDFSVHYSCGRREERGRAVRGDP